MRKHVVEHCYAGMIDWPAGGLLVSELGSLAAHRLQQAELRVPEDCRVAIGLGVDVLQIYKKLE